MPLRTILLVLFLFASFAPAAENAAPPPATEAVLKNAKTKAESEGKAILIVFHASWCGWCKRFDSFLTDTETKPVMTKYFVIEHLTVLERPSAQKSENPGGAELMTKLGGKEAGLPFFAMLDAGGDLLASSRRGGPEGPNIGHPFQPDEVAWFMSMVKKAAPKMSPAETATLEGWLQKQKRD